MSAYLCRLFLRSSNTHIIVFMAWSVVFFGPKQRMKERNKQPYHKSLMQVTYRKRKNVCTKSVCLTIWTLENCKYVCIHLISSSQQIRKSHPKSEMGLKTKTDPEKKTKRDEYENGSDKKTDFPIFTRAFRWKRGKQPKWEL